MDEFCRTCAVVYGMPGLRFNDRGYCPLGHRPVTLFRVWPPRPEPPFPCNYLPHGLHAFDSDGRCWACGAPKENT